MPMDYFIGKLSDIDVTFPDKHNYPKEAVWCLKLNEKLLVTGLTNWKAGPENFVGTINQLRKGRIPGHTGDWVEKFFQNHIMPVLESSEIPTSVHSADIPNMCAKFWELNCVFCYEKVDTRRHEWWKSFDQDGPFSEISGDPDSDTDYDGSTMWDLSIRGHVNLEF